MNRIWARRASGIWGAAAAAALALVGCGGDDDPTPAPATCSDEDKLHDVCVGVPQGDVCGSDTCTEGVACAAVVEVASDADLQVKAGGATAGSCLSLAPGQYTSVNLPGGVSLLGRSAGAVKIDAITLGAGAGAVVRGLAVGAGGIALQGATSVRIESVRVTGDSTVVRDGIALGAGASATIVTSTIDGAGRAGVFATDADVTIDRTVISGAQGSGVWVEGSSCDASCACSAPPTLTVTTSALRRNHLFGLSIRGTVATLGSVDVIGTLSGGAIWTGMEGGGVVVAACSDFSATRLRVLDSADYGVLIDGSKATLGEETNPDGSVEISRNLRGLWFQNILEGAGASLHNGAVTQNRGVGIGVAGESRGIVICRSAVKGTSSETLPVYDEGMSVTSKDVGDGVSWLENSQVYIEELTLESNARQSLLIDGPATGNIVSINLTGGDETRPALQQNLMPGGEQPMIGGAVSLMSQDTRAFAVPQALALPSALP